MPCTMWDLKAVAVHTMKLDGCAVDECWPRCYTQHKRAVKQLDALSVGARTKASSTLQCEESAIVAWVAIFYARGLQPKSLQRRKLRSSSVEAGRRGREVAVDALERDSVVHHHGCSLAPMSCLGHTVRVAHCGQCEQACARCVHVFARVRVYMRVRRGRAGVS